MTQSYGYFVNTDGGSRGNPGPAAYGFVIYDAAQAVILEKGEYIGQTTNNQAEYQAIAAALEALHTLPEHRPSLFRLDSQLVVRQINGQYRMKNAELKPWLDKVQQLRQSYNQPVDVTYVPREQNKEADRLVNLTLDAAFQESRYA